MKRIFRLVKEWGVLGFVFIRGALVFLPAMLFLVMYMISDRVKYYSERVYLFFQEYF